MAEATPLVLLIEDEPQMRRFLRAALESHGYRLVEAVTSREGLAQATSHNPDVILLDLGLTDGDGIDLARRIREWSATPIIVTSARGKELRVALRHVARTATAEPVFRVGDLRVDLAARQVFVRDAEIRLTPTEYKLLTALVHDVGKVVTHRHLLREVWGPNAVEHTHYLRVYMAQLRHKIERDPARPQYLQTEAGVGYRLGLE